MADRAGCRLARFLHGAACVLLLCVLVPVACAAMRMTAHAWIGDNRMNQCVLLAADRLLSNLLLTAAALGALMLVHRLLERMGMRLSAGLCALWLLCALFWVLGVGLLPRADSQIVLQAASEFAKGQYVQLDTPYFHAVSYQLGICLPLELIARLLPGADLNMLMQCVNTVLSIGAAGVMAALSGELFGSWRAQAAALLLYLAFLPMLLFCVYVYGTLPMIFLCACAFLCFARYLHTGRPRYGVGFALLLGMAAVVKPNAAIPVAALVICAVLAALEKRDARVLAYAALSVALAALLPRLVVWQYELRSGVTLGENTSMLARLAMGLQDSPIAAGWYTGYIEEFWDASVTAETEKAAAFANLMGRVQAFYREPAMAAEFLREKCLTQWLEPAYDMLWYGAVCPKAGRFNGLANLVYREGSSIRALLEEAMNVFQQAVYLLSCVGAVRAFRKRADAAQLILPVTVLGGFLYHMIFEAKSQYIYTYVFFMMPLAAQGLCTLEDMAAACMRRFKRRKWNEKQGA